jgi:hypothetical protein
MSRVQRQEFIEIVGDRIDSTGLRRAPVQLGCDGAIFCAAREGAFLAAAIEFSRKRRGSVTASWFVGATALWGYRPKDVPARAYVRAPTLLTMDEREELCGSEAAVAEGVSDFWWTGVTEVNANLVARSLMATCPRFVSVVPVREIRRSPLWTRRKQLVAAVMKGAGPAPSLDVLAEDGVPQIWHAVAADVLATAADDEPRVPTMNLAEDAALCGALGIA